MQHAKLFAQAMLRSRACGREGYNFKRAGSKKRAAVCEATASSLSFGCAFMDTDVPHDSLMPVCWRGVAHGAHAVFEASHPVHFSMVAMSFIQIG